jgi:hypothetical protein
MMGEDHASRHPQIPISTRHFMGTKLAVTSSVNHAKIDELQ